MNESINDSDMHPVVAAIEHARREQDLLGAMTLMGIIYEIVRPRPIPMRQRWWQIWRQR